VTGVQTCALPICNKLLILKFMASVLSVLLGLAIYLVVVDLVKIIITIYRKFKK